MEQKQISCMVTWQPCQVARAKVSHRLRPEIFLLVDLQDILSDSRSGVGAGGGGDRTKKKKKL